MTGIAAMNQSHITFIIARSTQMRNSFDVFLHSIPGIEVVCQQAVLSEAMLHCKDGNVALVVYAFERTPNCIEELNSLKFALPEVHIIVQVEGEMDCLQIDSSGVTYVPNGMLAARLASVIENHVLTT
jgi:hypothetical protein